MSNFQTLKRLYKDYTHKYLKKIIFAVFFAILVASSTSAIAYLLDPAIEKIFIEKTKPHAFQFWKLIKNQNFQTDSKQNLKKKLNMEKMFW